MAITAVVLTTSFFTASKMIELSLPVTERQVANAPFPSEEFSSSDYRNPVSQLITRDELVNALENIAQNPDKGRRVVALIHWIKLRSVDDCRVLLSGTGLPSNTRRLLVSRWMELDPAGAMAFFPNGEYLDLFATRDPVKAIEWTKQNLAGRDRFETGDLLDRLAEGLARHDPIFALQQVSATAGDLSSLNFMLDSVAARGTGYALQWMREVEKEGGDRFILNTEVLYTLAQWDPDDFLTQLKEPQNAGILENSRISVAAGLASVNPTRALDWLKAETGELDPNRTKYVAHELWEKDERDKALEWAWILPEDAAYDEARIEVATSVSYDKGIELSLKILGPERSETFQDLFRKWQLNQPKEAAKWAAENASRIPPPPPPAPESPSDDDSDGP